VRDQADGARIMLRIIEAETGAQIWAAAYDEPPGIEERPDLQARIARDAAAAAALFGPVFDAELALARRSTHSLELPDCQTRYRAFREATDPALFPEAFACFQGLVTRQPQLGHAWAGLAMSYIDEHVYYSGRADRGAALARARAALHTALELDPKNILANAALTRYQYYDGDPEFPRTAERALALDPDNPEMLGSFGILLTAYGDAKRGLELVARAHELSAQPRGVFNLARVFADLQDGKPCEALTQARALHANKWFIAHTVTAAAAGLCGDVAAAAEARSRLLAVTPSFDEEAVGLVDLWRFNPPLRKAVLDGLHAAGLTLPQDDAPAR
jgi:Tfp pilus assembly protein PilF